MAMKFAARLGRLKSSVHGSDLIEAEIYSITIMAIFGGLRDP
jgi:hypothetical protein